MKRRRFLSTISTAAAATPFLSLPSRTAEPAAAPLVTTPLVLMSPTGDGFDAVWGVSRLSKGKLLCEDSAGQTTEFAMDTFGFVPQGDKVLKVRARGLKPGATYRVQALTTAAGDGEQHHSTPKQVRTLDPGAPSTEFVVWNDTHINNETIRALHDATPAADFLLWNGDTCNDWTDPALIVPTLLNPGGRDISNGRPLLITHGNHDVRGPHAYAMADAITSPSDLPFYAFRSGPLAAICLHTGEDKPDSHPSFEGRVAFDPFRHTQAEWLNIIIRNPLFRDAPYRVVFCHIPLRWRDERPQDYATGGFDRVSLRSRELWHDALARWKAQLIISGHTHEVGWFPATEQFPYAQLTGGGPQQHSATWIHGKAGPDSATITVRNLKGALLHEIPLRPV